MIPFITHYLKEYSRAEDGEKYQDAMKKITEEYEDAIEDRSIEKAFIEQGRRNELHQKTQVEFKTVTVRETMRDLGIEK